MWIMIFKLSAVLGRDHSEIKSTHTQTHTNGGGQGGGVQRSKCMGSNLQKDVFVLVNLEIDFSGIVGDGYLLSVDTPEVCSY